MLKSFIEIMKGQGWTFRTVDDYSTVTPAAFALAEKKTPPNRLRPAQKLARKATVLTPLPKKRETSHTPTNQRMDKAAELAEKLSGAIRRQSFLSVRRLLAQGARINDRNARGELPLNIAIETNNAVMVRMLVNRSARIFSLDAYGMSPMGVARQHHATIIARYLQEQIARQRERRLQHPIFPSNESIIRQ